MGTMINDNSKYDFFISSAAEDVDFVGSVLRKMTDFNVFYPHTDMSHASGEMYFDVLAEALENSKNFILVISPDAVKSKWVKVEYQTFFNNFYSETNSRKIFLLKGKDYRIEDVPLFFRNFQIADNIDQIINRAFDIKKFDEHVSGVRQQENSSPASKPIQKKNHKLWVYLLIFFFAAVLLIFGGYLVYQNFFNTKTVFSEKPIRKPAEEIKAIAENQPGTDQEFDDEQQRRLLDEEIINVTKSDYQEFIESVSSEDISIDGNIIYEMQQIKDDEFDVFADKTKNIVPEIQLQDYIKTLSEAREVNYPNGNKYVGEMQDGVLHGQGIFYYAVRTLISKNDPIERYAEAGYYLIGEWSRGEFYMGRLYSNLGEMKDMIIIGRK